MNATVAAADCCPFTKEFFNVVAQLSHFAWGALVVIAVGNLAGKWTVAYTSVLFMMYAAIKEFVWDIREQEGATKESEGQDFGFYALGVAVGILVLTLSRQPGSMHPFACSYLEPADSESDEVDDETELIVK